MKKILLSGLITSIVVYFILLVLFFNVNRSISKSFALIELYISEIEQVKALELTVRKVEADVRVFLLSNDTSSIKELGSDMSRVDTSVAFIRAFVKNEPAQVARVNELTRLVQRRRELLRRTVQRHSRGELEIDNILRLIHLQARITEDIRIVLEEIVQDEYKFLHSEKEDLKSLKMQSYTLAAAAGFFPLVIAFLTVYSLAGLVKERGRIEKKLSNLLANRDKFLAIIGHDLKGPAGAIKLMAQMLVEQKGRMSPEQEMKMKERLLSATTNQLKLLEDLTAWAKTQTQTMEFNPVIIDLRCIIEESILRMTEMAISKGITISHSVTSGVPVHADVQMIQAVMRNLLQNAVKFTSHGGLVEVGCKVIDNMVEVSVADTGVGMPSDKLNRLFSPGSQVSTKGTEGEAGTGLGLILCKEFIDRHDGRIWVESTKGKGSVFYFTLPLPA
jgi:signal transduction histidine kinase